MTEQAAGQVRPDRVFIEKQLGELYTGGEISLDDLDSLVEQVEKAASTADAIAVVKDLPAIVPESVGQGIPVRGNRGEVMSHLAGARQLGWISQPDWAARADLVEGAIFASQLAIAVKYLPPMPEPGSGEPGKAPVDAVRPGLTHPLADRTSMFRFATVEDIFKGDEYKVDESDRPACERTVNAVRAQNAHGMLERPPPRPRTGDLLADMVETDRELNYLIFADAGQLRTDSKRPGFSTPPDVPAAKITEQVGRISADFRRDKMLQGLSKEEFGNKVLYYLVRLEHIGALRDGGVPGDRNLSVERMVLSDYARAAGWDINWARAPDGLGDRLEQMGDLYFRTGSVPQSGLGVDFQRGQYLLNLRAWQAAVGEMISPVSRQSIERPPEWAAAEVRRLDFHGDLRITEAVGYEEAVALRGESAPAVREGPHLGPVRLAIGPWRGSGRDGGGDHAGGGDHSAGRGGSSKRGRLTAREAQARRGIEH